MTTKQLKMAIRNKIEKYKNDNGLTYEDMGRKSGYTPQTISNAINRCHAVKIETMEEIWESIKK